MRIGELFAGYGGLGMGVQSVLGGEIAWHSEIEPAACKILAHHWPDVPNLGDVTAVDWSQVEPVDVVTMGFPCQDLSGAGLRKGLKPGTRSGLWTHAAYAISKLHPSLVVIENVRGLLSATAEHPAHSDVELCPWCLGDDEPVSLRALGAVLGDLADIGFDAAWTGLRAADVGAPHGRFRVFVVAWPAADTSGGELQRRGVRGVLGGAAAACQGDRSEWERDGHSAGDRRPTSADARGRGGAPAAHADLTGLEGRQSVRGGSERVSRPGRLVDWGPYGPAVARWERVLGRPAPSPTEPGRNGQPRLSPAFVEWLMGLPVGHVTAVPGVSRNEQLKALGNGVVPQQAAEALRRLLPMTEERAA